MLRKKPNIFCGSINTKNFNETIKKALPLMNQENELFQIIKKDLIVSEKQIIAAFLKSLASFKAKKNRLQSLSLEFFVNVLACKQLDEALRLNSFSKTKNDVIIIICASKKKQKKLISILKKWLSFKEKKCMLKPTKNTIKAFKFNEKELRMLSRELGKEKAIELLLLEKITLTF